MSSTPGPRAPVTPSVARYGPRTTLIVGLLVIAVGYAGGLGLMNAAWQTVVTSWLDRPGRSPISLPRIMRSGSETAPATPNTLMRSIGTSVSSAVIGMVLANTANDVGGVAVPTMHGFRVSFLIHRPPHPRPAFSSPPTGDTRTAPSSEDANLAARVPPDLPFRGRVLTADGTPVPARSPITARRQARPLPRTGYASVPAAGPYAPARHAPLAHAHHTATPSTLDLASANSPR
ncbi:hypothetical protein [Streptomyces sp. DHE17-7]|uniref:hypothetical protein n=1 Tax=Streptomyces sp. DHE17-7 TaxID=2759949 RepID=UPI003FA78249|nr:hypothetical protein [Streptomyces sp. DHE17-7]